MQEENREDQNIPFVYQDDAITLPLNKEAFKDFMVSLLGKPELLEGYREGAFEIDFDRVNYFHELLDERISNQNNASFVEFTAKLHFSDQTSYEFSNIYSFLKYRENYQKPNQCIGFNFTWIYLIKFNNKNHSEKQEISVFTSQKRFLEKNKKQSVAQEFFSDFFDNLPRISYSIRHTNLKWSLEIEEVIKGFFNSIFELEGNLAFLRKMLLKNMPAIMFYANFKFE